MKPPILLSASLVLGFCAGLVARHSSDQSDDQTRGRAAQSLGTEGLGAGLSGASQGGAGSAGAGVTLAGASQAEGFADLSPEKQREALERLSGRLFKSKGTGDQLLLAKVVRGLGFEQASAMLALFPKGESGKPEASDLARTALIERMAALNPAAVLDMGRKGEDPKLAQAAVMALAQKNAADALRALAQMPEKFLASVGAEMRGGFVDSVGKASGTIAEMTAVLKENPQLLDLKSPSEGAVRRLLGQVASQAAMSDPAAAMADVRQLAAALVQVKPGEDLAAAQSAMVARIASQMTRTLRADSVGADRVVFNALTDNEKNDTMVALEAASRFREGGVESAIQFAESQGKERLTQNAASGVWWSLAQQDRASALKWLETLPPGPFRDGALTSLMQEASFRTRSFGDSAEPVRAGAELLSQKSRLDYYALVTAQKRGAGVSQSEFSTGLPISEADKNELRRRMAPIRPK